MKFSVVIPTYNRAKIVVEAIGSVLAQTYGDFELIVVDDGSTDDTAARLNSFLADGRIRYYWQKNSGVAAARNAGVALSKGEFIAFLDSDDLWKPNKLECEAGFIKNNPEVKIVFSDLEKYDGNIHTPSFMRMTYTLSRLLAGCSYPDGIVFKRKEPLLFLLEEVPIKMPAFTINTRLFNDLKGFNELYRSGEDWEFFLRTAMTEELFGYIDRPLAVIRISEDSRHNVEKETDHLDMLKLLLNMKKKLDKDPEAIAAANCGINNICKHLSWHYRKHGRSLDEAKTCLCGYRATHDVGMLLRALAVFLPQRILKNIRHVLPAS